MLIDDHVVVVRSGRGRTPRSTPTEAQPLTPNPCRRLVNMGLGTPYVETGAAAVLGACAGGAADRASAALATRRVLSIHCRPSGRPARAPRSWLRDILSNSARRSSVSPLSPPVQLHHRLRGPPSTHATATLFPVIVISGLSRSISTLASTRHAVGKVDIVTDARPLRRVESRDARG